MPPLPFEDHGRVAVADFLTAICGIGRFKLIAGRANGQPTFGCYMSDGTAPIASAHGLLVLTLADDQNTAITRFIDDSVLPHFGLPRTLPDT
jgi:hypothetical protein